MLDEWIDFRNYTLKHYLIIFGSILFIGIALYLFLSSKKEEQEKIKAEKEAFILVYNYEEDLLRPVVEKELTIDELVEVIVSEQLGAGGKPVTFPKSTIRDTWGLFTQSGIIEGDKIPTISALSIGSRENMNKEESNEYMEELYAKISAEKQKAVSEYRSTDVDETEVLLAELKKRLAEQ